MPEVDGHLLTREQRGGILAAVITGGRPKLTQRPTRHLLAALKEYGVSDVVWVMREADLPLYERDKFPIVTYTDEWAYEYAVQHWMHLDRPEPGGFLGAFPGREWACLEAERRGCWGVLQLDDNITALTFPRNSSAGALIARHAGGSALFADTLGALSLSTNGMTVGAQLTSVPKTTPIICRPGFPYSFFLEKVGPGREHWYGPFEDDITHAFQYGTRGDGVTSLVVPMLRYCKEGKSKTGMRSKYDPTRAVQLQRIFPESAHIGIRKAHSNGSGGPRVFHTMNSDAIRNPLVVKDRETFTQVKTRMEGLLSEWQKAQRAANRMKVLRRTAGV
jgi:hypothetical protein